MKMELATIRETVSSKLAKMATKKDKLSYLISIVGSLSAPSKMPCYSYSIPAEKCITGSKLREIDGSVCSDCYACKGCYVFKSTKNAMQFRFDSLSDLSVWAEHMIELIRLQTPTNDLSRSFFRWHDSGDLQSIEHLKAINSIALALPYIKFWLPTREYDIVRQFTSKNIVAPNLTIRLSAHMIGKNIERIPLGMVASSVDSGIGEKCPASKQGNECADCRNCWDKNIKNIDYVQH